MNPNNFKWFSILFAIVFVFALILGVAFYSLIIGILYKIFASIQVT